MFSDRGTTTALLSTAAIAALALAATGRVGTARAADATADAVNSAGGSDVGAVVVTARKRSENIQRVPLAVTAQTGRQLEQQGVRQTTDLTRVVPSLTVALSLAQNTGAVFSLRGQVAADPLLTTSQAVGLYLDTLNVPHPDGLQGSFFDIDRVEVLKGPQGTLYGRNTTGGAVNIITRGADYNGFHGFVMAEGGNLSDFKGAGAINIPLITDKLAVRLAYQHWQRSGFGRSIVNGERLGADHDDDIVRLSVRFDPAQNFHSSTKFEYSRFNQHGVLMTLVALPAGSAAGIEAAAELGPFLDFTPANPCGSFSCAALGAGSTALNAVLNNQNMFENSNNARMVSQVYTLHGVEDLTWDITDSFRARSISGFHRVSDFQTLDLDATQFQVLEIGAGTDHDGVQPVRPPAYPYRHIPENLIDSWSQEVDFSGKLFDRVDWLVGAYGSWETGQGGEPFVAFGVLSQTFGNPVVTTGTNDTKATSQTWAIYTQEDFHLTDALSLTAGLRYTQEQSTNAARLFSWVNGVFTCNPPDRAPAGFFLAPGNNPDNCPTSTDLGLPSRESAVGTSYLFSINYQITPDILVYAKTARGFRGGALQPRSPSLPPVAPEIAVDYELGFKTEFFDHRLRLNLAAYETNYKNKQENVIVAAFGGSTTILFNAATARIQGFEAEATLHPAAGLSVYGNMTYLRGKYLNFTKALNPEGSPIDASGMPFLDPTWRYSIGGRYEHDLGPGKIAGELDWTWRSHNNLSPLHIDPLFSVDLQRQLNSSIGLLNARVEYNIQDLGLSFAFFATNLLDKHYQTQALLSGPLGIGTAQTQEPRMWGFSVVKRFGAE